MNDQALAPVVAVMLILAIGVTVFAVYNSTYLPGLKQQAEVEHFKEVESGFAKFSSDIDNAVASGKSNITYSEQVPLGGGDILVNSIRSSGTIRIQNESLGTITINNSSAPPIPLSLITYSYAPEGNFWVNQSYDWEHGYINITKGTRSTPLQYDSMGDPRLIDTVNTFADHLISDNDDKSLQIIRIVGGADNVSSSNGVARLDLTMKDVTEEALGPGFFNLVQNVSINYTPSRPGDAFQSRLTDKLPLGYNNVSVKVIEITVGVN